MYISREKERLDTCNIGHGSMSYSRYISILAVPVAIAIVFQVSLLIIVHSCKQPWPVGTNSILDTKGYTKKWYVMVNELRQLHEMSIFFW